MSGEAEEEAGQAVLTEHCSYPAGVGGIEAEAVMLGQPISMVLPEVVGYRLSGVPDRFITSTDIVLTVTGVTAALAPLLGPLGGALARA